MAPGGVAAATRGPSKLQPTAKVRYWKGKPQGAELDPEDSDEESEEDEEESAVKRRKRIEAQKAAEREAKLDKDVVAGGAGRVLRQGAGGIVKVDLKNVEVGKALPVVVKKEEEESEEEESDEEEEEVKPVVSIPKPPGSESSEYETDSEEESEEEKKPAFRPVFVRKDARGMTQEKAQAIAEEKIRLEEELRDQRKNDSKEIAGETIRRELIEKESTDIVPDIDDTDGLDPTAEFESWRARELSRLLRDKQAQAAKDEEQAEIERRRAMPEEQRLREDMEFAEASRNVEKGEMGFLQKYYHKGAFHGDDDLLRRDYTGATESAVDVSMLPKVMQVRDFGKASRTKYTHLANEDTSAGGWGQAARLPASMGMGAPNPNAVGGIGTTQTGCWNCGGPHVRSACPNQNINDPLVLAGVANLGAGSLPLPYSQQPQHYGAGMGMGGGGGGGQGRGQAAPPMENRPQDAGYGQRRGGDASGRGGFGGGGGERREERRGGPSDGRDRRGEERRGYDDDRRGGQSSRETRDRPDRPERSERSERPRERDEGRYRDDERRHDSGRHDERRHDDRKRARSPDDRREGKEGDDRRRREKERDRDGRGGDDRRRRDERDRDRDGGRDRDRDRR